MNNANINQLINGSYDYTEHAETRSRSRAARTRIMCFILKGANGVSTNGVTANFKFLTEGLFGYSRPSPRNVVNWSFECTSVHTTLVRDQGLPLRPPQPASPDPLVVEVRLELAAGGAYAHD